LPDAAHALIASLDDPSALSAGETDFDWLFFTAGPGETTELAYRRTYIEGLQNALRAFGGGARRVLVTSSTAVYAQVDGERVDETSPTSPTHFSGRVLLEAESALWRARPDAVVLRLGGIYGPGRASMVESVRRGEATYVEGDESVVNRMHRDDCAGALAHLAELADGQRLYLGVDDEPTTRREVMTFIASRLGAPPPRAVTRAERPQRRSASNKRCSNERLRSSGYRLLYPTYREGYGAVIDRPID